MQEFGVYEAKTKLPALLKVRRGQEITITKHGVPIALIIPYTGSARPPVQETIGKIRELRKGVLLADSTISQAIEEGRRY